MLSKVYVLALIIFSCGAFGQETCLKKAEKLMAQAKKMDATPARWGKKHLALLQDAQNNFICAAREGNAYAGYEAVTLANQQLANEIAPELTVSLLKSAAEAGHAQAALTLGTYFCGNQVTGCAAPEKAMPWLKKAIELGNSTAAISMGQLFEYGYGSAINLPKAIGCYQKASTLGDSNGATNAARLKNKGVYSAEECLN
ncbi:MAG: hypothetical protein U1F46_13135 [Marinagarivorans sp.]